MRLRERVQRLERTAADIAAASGRAAGVAAAMEQRKTYLRGRGPCPPDPPCPPGNDPDDWESRMRVSRCFDARSMGEVSPGGYLPEMDEGQRAYMDGLTEVLAVFGRHAEPPEGR